MPMFCYKLIPIKDVFLNLGRPVVVGEILLVKTSFIFDVYTKETKEYFRRPVLVEIKKDSLNEDNFEFCSISHYDKIILQDKIITNSNVRVRKNKG